MSNDYRRTESGHSVVVNASETARVAKNQNQRLYIVSNSLMLQQNVYRRGNGVMFVHFPLHIKLYKTQDINIIDDVSVCISD